MYEDHLLLYLISYAIIVVIMLLAGFNRRMPSAGLPLVFVFNLTMNHYFGAFVHALPWFSTGGYEFTYLGFEQTLFGLGAFAAGALLIGPWVIVNIFKKPRGETMKPHPKLVTRYLQIGFVTYFLLGPALGRIPTVATFVQSAWTLLIAAVCLLCWKAWTEKKSSLIFVYLALSVLFPFSTSFNSGFLNLGVRAVISILFFTATFFRPRWVVIATVFVSMYLGLSIYVTYFRDRTELRDAIWYGQLSKTQRIEKVLGTLTNFELFDVKNQDHLMRIDLRLNQNDFVGKSVVWLRDGHVPFARGTTFSDAVISLVPRFLWPDKPVYAGSGNLVSRYTGEILSETTSFGIGYVMELYINFGTASVVIGFLILGIFFRVLDFGAARHLVRGNWQGFTLWFLPACGFTETVDTIPSLFSAWVAAAIFCFFIHRFLLRSFGSARAGHGGRKT